MEIQALRGEASPSAHASNVLGLQMGVCPSRVSSAFTRRCYIAHRSKQQEEGGSPEMLGL